MNSSQRSHLINYLSDEQDEKIEHDSELEFENNEQIYINSLAEIFDDEIFEDVDGISALLVASSIVVYARNCFTLPPVSFIESSKEAKKLLIEIALEIAYVAAKKLVSLQILKSDLTKINICLRQLKDVQTDCVDDLRIILERVILNKDENVTLGFGVARRLKKHITEIEKNLSKFTENKYRIEYELKKISERKLNDISNFFPELVRKEVTKVDNRRFLKDMSLEYYSFLYERELQYGEGPVHIIHFFESSKDSECYYVGSPRASEYLISYNSDNEEDINSELSFVQTNHGLGSAIYGVGSQCISKDTYRKDCPFVIIEITRPLRLVDAKESEIITRVSKDLQRFAEQIKNYQRQKLQKEKMKITRRKSFDLCVSDDLVDGLVLSLFSVTAISQAFSKDNLKEIINKEILAFIEDAKHFDDSIKLVEMPINYLIRALGFNGIVSEHNDRFSRGLVAYDVPPSDDFKTIPVKSAYLKSSLSEFFSTERVKSDSNTEISDSNCFRH